MPTSLNAEQSSGVRANHSGQELEQKIEEILRQSDFNIIPFKEWNEAILYELEKPKIAILDAPYIGIYGGNPRIELLLIIGDRQILVETKRQKTSGSYDEKLAYVYLTAKANLKQREYVLVMDGDGWREGARDWIDARAKETPGFTVLKRHNFLNGW